MKVYTKTGDKGTTALIGGTRVAKNNVRLEAYGGVDELNSHLGMIRSYPIDGESVKQLIEIQNVMFVVGANLATDTAVSNMQKKLPCTDEDVAFLERAIYQLTSQKQLRLYFHNPPRSPPVQPDNPSRTSLRRWESATKQWHIS